MQLKSVVTGNEYYVKTYTNEDGTKGICHESLQDILENQLEGVRYQVDVLSATPSYCAAACTIENTVTGRKVQGFNDVNTDVVEDRDRKQAAFASAHPVIVATQAAVDTAVRAYLQWPKTVETGGSYAGASVISMEENIPTVADSPANTSAEEDSVPFEADLRIPSAEGASDAPSVEDVETEDACAEGADGEAVFDEESPEEAAQPTDAEPSASAADKAARLAELGKMSPPANSKYGKNTFDEIWETSRNWFSYIVNKNRSAAYETAREYAMLRQELYGEQL